MRSSDGESRIPQSQRGGCGRHDRPLELRANQLYRDAGGTHSCCDSHGPRRAAARLPRAVRDMRRQQRGWQQAGQARSSDDLSMELVLHASPAHRSVRQSLHQHRCMRDRRETQPAEHQVTCRSAGDGGSDSRADTHAFSSPQRWLRDKTRGQSQEKPTPSPRHRPPPADDSNRHSAEVGDRPTHPGPHQAGDLVGDRAHEVGQLLGGDRVRALLPQQHDLVAHLR